MYLGRRFVSRSGQRAVNSAMEKNRRAFIQSLFKPFMHDRRSFFGSNALKFDVIRLGHVRKSRTETFVILTQKRISSHQVEMVGDQHQTALRHIGVETAGGVR